MPREEIAGFLRSIPASFCDPLTGLQPSSERELTAVLAAKHQFKKINWDQLPVLSCGSLQIPYKAGAFISQSDFVFCEYPLFAQTQTEIDRWGGMTPDITFWSEGLERLTVVECKLDSGFTHSNSPPHGQISRYLDYLENCRARETALVLICPECNKEWYATHVHAAVKQRQPRSKVVVLTWESLWAVCEA